MMPISILIRRSNKRLKATIVISLYSTGLGNKLKLDKFDREREGLLIKVGLGVRGRLLRIGLRSGRISYKYPL